MAKYRVGYVYEQVYNFDKEGVHHEGVTTRAVVHTLDSSGRIKRTFDYKVAPQFAPYLTTGDCGSPAFDSFGRLADFFDEGD